MFRNLSTIGLPLSGRQSELIELALSFGFDGMDVDIIDLAQQADVYGLAHARRLMVSARLKSGVFHLPVELAADEPVFNEQVAALAPLLEIAAAAEAPRAVARIEPASDEHPFKDFFELHRTRLHTLGDLLGRHGVTLGLTITPERAARADKAHEFIHNYEGLLGLVAVSHERIGAVVDSWALFITGESPEVVGGFPPGRLVEVRLSDAPRGAVPAELEASQRLLVGETGVIDAAAVLARAAAAGFEGPATPWAARAAIAGRGREKVVRLAGERMEAAWKSADLPILPRWFAPVLRDQFGRPIEETADLEAVAGVSPAAGDAE